MSTAVDLLPATLIALLAVPPLVRAAPRLGLVDRPTSRSLHAVPVARVGGLAMACGLLGALAVLGLRGSAALEAGATWLPYALPAACYLGIGWVDDRRRLRPHTKFLLQALAASLAVALGLRWSGAALGPFEAIAFGPATAVMTWLWLVAVVVLVNFVDGIDLITAATAVVVLGAAGGGGAGPAGGFLYLLLGATVVGFGYWNLRPAHAFPGDAGTHLIGFFVATAALELPGGTTGLPWAAASAPLLPGVIDVALGLGAKARSGVALWKPHGQHVHQRLTRAGWTHAAVALRYGLLSIAALWLTAWVAPRWGLGTCVVLSLAILGLHYGTAWRRTHGIPYRW